MFCASAVHSKAALLNWIKSLCALKRVLTLAKANSYFSEKCVETETNVCEIVPALWNNGKKALKWHKFALCETTWLVKNQDAHASHWDVQCKGRSVRASMASNCCSHHCAAKLRHRTLCSSIPNGSCASLLPGTFTSLSLTLASCIGSADSKYQGRVSLQQVCATHQNLRTIRTTC